MEIKATSLSQEELKSKAVKTLAKLIRRPFQKLLRTLKKSTSDLLQMFQIHFLKKWADKKAKGEDGRSDVPPKTYFQEDEDLLNMIQNVTIHQ